MNNEQLSKSQANRVGCVEEGGTTRRGDEREGEMGRVKFTLH